MTDHHRRLSALQLKNAEDTIRQKLRGMKYRLYTRISANIPVYTKGNEVREQAISGYGDTRQRD
jgi:hypothetical protein